MRFEWTVGCALGLALLLGGCANSPQPATSTSSPSVSPECVEPVAAEQRVGAKAMVMPTDTPQQKDARLSSLAVTLQIVVDHPGCFSSETVAGAERALANMNKP